MASRLVTLDSESNGYEAIEYFASECCTLVSGSLAIKLDDSAIDLRMSYDVCDRMLKQSSTQDEIALTVELLDPNTEEVSDKPLVM